MKVYTNKQLFDLINAVVHLERAGQKWLIDYGYDNAIDKYRALRKQKPKKLKRPEFPRGTQGYDRYAEPEQRFTQGTSTYDGQKCGALFNVTNWP